MHNRIKITAPEALEEIDREAARNRSHDERMAYLNRLIHITHSDEDIFNLERKFYEGKIFKDDEQRKL